MPFLSEEHLVLASSIGPQVFAEQVDALERHSEPVADVVTECEINRSVRLVVARVAAAAIVHGRQELAAPIVRYASREPVLFEDCSDVGAVAQTGQSEYVGARRRSAVEVNVTKHLRQRARDTEPAVAEEVLTLKLESVDLAGPIVN